MIVEAISSVFVRDKKGYQLLVFYVSKALIVVETCYPDMKKLAPSLITTFQKLSPYS